MLIHYDMIRLRLLFFLLFLAFFSTSLFSQKIVAFDKRGKVKRIKYYKSEYIKLKTINNEVIAGNISRIDSNYFVVGKSKVMLDSVKRVYNTQRLYGIKLMGNVFVLAGTGYITLDAFNRLINNDNPIIETETIAYSSAFVGTGIILNFIANRGYRISSKRPLKIIDLTI